MVMNVAPISFCNKLAFNVRDDKYKTSLLKKVFNKYNIIVTDNSCQIYNKHYASLISKSKYLLSTNTKGNRYFLYFTKDDFDNNLCFFIDRKICKGYQYPRIIYTKYRFDDKVFEDTLIHGELIKDFDDNWIFLVNDIFAYCGKKCFRDDKLKRIQKMYELFNESYFPDPILDVCNFQIKRYFEYKQFNNLVTNFIPNLRYKINGIMFNSITFKKPNILLLKHFKTINQNNLVPKEKTKKKTLFDISSNNVKSEDVDIDVNISNNTDINISNKIENKNHKSDDVNKINKQCKQSNYNKNNNNNVHDNKVNNNMNKSNENIHFTIEPKTIEEETLLQREYFTFIVERTTQGIFQLTCFINQNKKIFGYARTNMKTQKMLLDLLKSNKYKENDLLMKCKYNKKFKKFVPIEETDAPEPDQYIDIKKYVSLI